MIKIRAFVDFDGVQQEPVEVLDHDDEFVVVRPTGGGAIPPMIFSRATGSLVAGFTRNNQGYHVDHDVVLILG